jgi:hypothetical protein
MPKTKVTVEGIPDTVKYLKDNAAYTAKATMEGLTKATLYVESEVKQSIAGYRAEPKSVLTGRFLQSITSDVQKEDGVVYSDVEYAPELEYGTSKRPARNHFRNSLSRSQEKCSEFINEEVKKKVK